MMPVEDYITEVDEEQRRLEREFSNGRVQIQPNFETTCTSGFAANEILTVLAFIVTTVTAGFLAEIGKDIWVKLKDSCRRVIRHQKGVTANRVTEVRVTILQGANVAALTYFFRVTTRADSATVENAADIFWDTLHEEIIKDFSVTSSKDGVQSVILAKEFLPNELNQRGKWVKLKG